MIERIDEGARPARASVSAPVCNCQCKCACGSGDASTQSNNFDQSWAATSSTTQPSE